VPSLSTLWLLFWSFELETVQSRTKNENINTSPSSHASPTSSSSTASHLHSGVIAVIAIGATVAVASLAGLLFLLHRRHTVSNKILESLHTTSEYVDPPLQPYDSSKGHELLGSSGEHEVHAKSRGSRMSESKARLLLDK
jgi:hypothetical protein